jgi:multiple antibiotic resistance protein
LPLLGGRENARMWLTMLRDLCSLFVITSPLGAVPLFLSMTARDPLLRRRRTAIYAALVATATLLVAVLLGSVIFSFFGISLEAFRIAGGIVLFIYSMDMIHVRTPRMVTTVEEVEVGVEKDEVGIIPLGIPMLAGPGAIATVLALRAGASQDGAGLLPLVLAIGIQGPLIAAVLLGSVGMRRWFTPVITGVVTRLQGLLLAAIAVQMAVSGVLAFHALPAGPTPL